MQQWTKHFSPIQPYPSVVLAWIRLPNLLGHLYKRKIIEAIGSFIGKVVKLDVHSKNQTRGRFARLAIYINMEKPLISQVLVNVAAQRVEYEALPIVCFTCGKYGHVKDMCPTAETEQNLAASYGKPSIEVDDPNESKLDGNSTGSRSREKEPEFGP